jgi:AcrR family transcriptional regulator
VGLPSRWTARDRPTAWRCRLSTTQQDTAPSPRRRARRGEGALLREEILAAAEEILIRTGDRDAVSIRAVADAVGVTPPSIYLHFADKNELLFAVCERHFAALGQALAEARRSTDDPLAQIAQTGLAYLRFGLERPELYRILFLGHPKDDPRDLEPSVLEEMAAFGQATELVRQLMDAGLIHRGDPRMTAIGLWAMVHGLVSLFICKPQVAWGDRERLAEALCRQHLEGLLTPRARELYPDGIPGAVGTGRQDY